MGTEPGTQASGERCARGKDMDGGVKSPLREPERDSRERRAQSTEDLE